MGTVKSKLKEKKNPQMITELALNSPQVFFCAYLFDEHCNHQVFPKDIIRVICANFLTFDFGHAFDQKGVLSWLRKNLNSNEKKNVILFFRKLQNRGSVPDERDYPTNYTYFLTPEVLSIYHLQQSRSIEILGQEANGTFCSSNLEKEKHFIVDLKILRLKLTHITMSCMHHPQRYLISNENVSPTFWGSNDPSSIDNWEIIKSDWKVIDVQEFTKSSGTLNNYQHRISTWKCNSENYYRYFKIKQHTETKNHDDNASKGLGFSLQTLISGLEMYGVAF